MKFCRLLFILLFATSVFGKVLQISKNTIEEYKENLENSLNAFINSENEKVLKSLANVLPGGPKKAGSKGKLEKDVFSLTIEKNKQAVKILESKVEFLEEKVKQLRGFLDLQQNIKEKWNCY